MTILDFIPAESFRHVAGTSGGEWAGPCPWCCGTDRFRAWPNHEGEHATGGRFLCRQCGKKGDGIAFLMESKGLSYPDSCRALQVTPRPASGHPTVTTKSTVWSPQPAKSPSPIWQHQARQFVTECSANMTPGSEGMDYAISRGLEPGVVKMLRIGWNPRERWEDRSAWGLTAEVNNKGNPRKVWLPAGLVIPSERREDFTAVKMRTQGNTIPKYVAVAGSVPGMFVSSHKSLPIVVVESEIDACLVWQEAGGLVGALALGSAGNRPDADMADRLRSAGRILVALDYDPAGQEATKWWRDNFSQARPHPVLRGKDVGDMIGELGLVRKWVNHGLSLG